MTPEIRAKYKVIIGLEVGGDKIYVWRFSSSTH